MREWTSEIVDFKLNGLASLFTIFLYCHKKITRGYFFCVWNYGDIVETYLKSDSCTAYKSVVIMVVTINPCTELYTLDNIPGSFLSLILEITSLACFVEWTYGINSEPRSISNTLCLFFLLRFIHLPFRCVFYFSKQFFYLLPFFLWLL